MFHMYTYVGYKTFQCNRLTTRVNGPNQCMTNQSTANTSFKGKHNLVIAKSK